MTWYRTSTVAVTNGSPTVTGSGTAFVANVNVGDAFIGPSGMPHEITAVVSNTELTLASGYVGTTASGQAYKILRTRSFANDLAVAAAALLNTFAAVRDGIGAGLFPSGTVSVPAIRAAADQDTGIFWSTANAISFACGGVAAFVLGAASATLVGNAIGTGTMELGSGGSGNRGSFIDFHGDDTYADFALRISRGNTGANSDSIITHRGTANLYLSALDAGGVIIQTAAVNRLVIEPTSGVVRPGVDNTQTLGLPAYRWSTVYAGSGSINTSDERLKKWRGGLNDKELAAAKEIVGSIGIYQFLDAVEEKGARTARLHCGVKAQQVIAIMEAHGLKPTRYGFVCYDAWGAEPEQPAVPELREDVPALLDDEGRIIAAPRSRVIQEARPAVPALAAGDRYGVRYDELAMFLAAAQEQRLAAIEAKLAA